MTRTARDCAVRAAPLAIGAAALALLPLLGGAYAERVFTLAGIYALLVIGYQFIFGHAGALSLAQGAFFGLGAYAAGILAVRWGWPFPAAFAAALLVPGAVAAIVAVPVLRLETHYFALATLGLAETALLVATNWADLTGGANGLSGVPPVAVLGWTASRGWPLLVLVWSFVAAAGAFAWLRTRGLAGLAYRLLRERPLAAGAVGIDGGRLRASAFVLSAVYAGAAGALFAHSLGVVSPETLAFPVMVSCLTMAVIGGRTRVAGAILGAVLLVHLPEWLRGFESLYLVAYGAAALAVVIAAPEGLVGLALRLVPGRPIAEPTRMPVPSARAPRTLAPAAKTPLLALEGLAKSFGGVRAVDGVSLAIAPGEVVGLIGPNGSGKTTLANLVTGLYRPDAGRIRLGGRDITGARAFRVARRGLTRSFQSPELIEGVSLLDNVALGDAWRVEGHRPRLSLDDRRLGDARRRAAEALARLGIAEAAAVPSRSLPPASLRRAEIARALLLEPRLLVLDEPSAGSSTAEAAELAAILAALAETGLTLLVIDHNLPFLARFASRLCCLELGRLIADGRPAEVRAHPRVIEAYLGRSEDAA